jgi:putative CocE/NonD family hydrolase
LHIGGWFDVCLQGTLDNYVAMTQLRRPARLVIGPWSHSDALSDPIGQLCFGVRSGARMPPNDLAQLQLSWFRRHLLVGAQSVEDEPMDAPVRIFVMGRNEWREETEWPPRGASTTEWFLGSSGTLSPRPPQDSMLPTTFFYDPADPVPTVGGHVVLDPAIPSGAFDQARVESRADVCVFTSETLTEDLEVIGRIRVVLHVESSAPSTDWVARLCDVHQDGRSFNVCDGILRLTEGANRCRRIEIDLWSTSIVFLAGHRLRVHVTSSSFPRWDRNLNTGNQREPRFEGAHQRVYHDVQLPSWLELPVMP